MKFEASGADLGVSSPKAGITDRGMPPAMPIPSADHSPDGAARTVFDAAEIRDLRLEVARLRAERDKLLENQRRVMDLLHTVSPEKIIHDLRNVLNERELYRTLADIDSLAD